MLRPTLLLLDTRQVVVGRPLHEVDALLLQSVMVMCSGDDDDRYVPFMSRALQQCEVPFQQDTRLPTSDGIVFMHCQQAVNDKQRCSCDGQFSGQTIQLVVELMQGEPPAQVQTGEGGFNRCPPLFEQWNKTTGINAACTVNPVHCFALCQCVGHPMLHHTAHCFPVMTGAFDMVDLTSLWRNVGRVQYGQDVSQNGMQVGFGR